MDQLKELVFLKGVRRLGFEDAAMSVQSFRRLEKALDEEGHPPCKLVPASEPIMKLRQTKDAASSKPWKPPRALPSGPWRTF